MHSLDAIGLRLYKSHVGPARLASRELVAELLKEAATAVTRPQVQSAVSC